MLIYNSCMKLYIFIILIGCIFTSVLAVSIGVRVYSLSDGVILLSILFSLLLLIIIDAVVAIFVRIFPKKWVNPFNKIYTVHKWESKFYVKLGIRKWKDLIPESGKMLTGFGKREVLDMKDNAYLFKFMEETVYAEVMHLLSAVLGFLVVFVNLKLWFLVGIPLAIFNFILQILPAMVQRYNRPKLMLAYRRNEKYNQSISEWKWVIKISTPKARVIF